MDAFETLKARGFVQSSTGEEAIREALSKGTVTFYVGVDPTGPSMHIGHLLPVMAMAWLQRAGHRAISVLGGGTAMVGDPSGKTEMREIISPESIEANGKALQAQLQRFLEFDDAGERGIMVNNADWLMGLGYIAFLRDVGRHFRVNNMIKAESVRLRLEREQGLSFIEFNYQLLQAYDYLELFRREGCTLQIGGDDQWFNILAGIDLIRREESAEALGLTLPLITTASGAKMGKTADGAVWLDADMLKPFDFYQYWINVADADVGRFLKLYTFLPLDRIAELEALQGADIRDAKKVLAWEQTVLVHGEEAAREAVAATQAMLAGAASDDMPTFDASGVEDRRLVVVLADSGMAKSRGEARRLIKGGGVRIDGDKVGDPELVLPALPDGGIVVRIGKKRALRVL